VSLLPRHDDLRWVGLRSSGDGARRTDAAYYDAIYRQRPGWEGQRQWEPLWQRIAAGLRPEDRVLEVGCGPGGLAAVLAVQGHNLSLYMGTDFSQPAIEQARASFPDADFYCGPLPDCLPHLIGHHRPTVVVACEVLEHLTASVERGTLAAVQGIRTVVTVPRYDDVGHQRFFPTRESCVEHYTEILGFVPDIEPVPHSHWTFTLPPGWGLEVEG
jgi:SAM-dependent methyltransferase